MFTDPTEVALIWVFTALLLPIIPALLLYKFLPSTADVSGPFRGLQIKLGGAFAAYFLLVIVVYFWPRPKMRDLGDEVWTVKGLITEQDGTPLPPDKMALNIQPRTVQYYNDGSFQMDVLFTRDHNGQITYPTLSVERQPAQPFGNATVHLDPAIGALSPKKYKLTVNKELHEISIEEPIVMQKVQEKPYTPAGPAPQPTVVPPAAVHNPTP